MTAPLVSHAGEELDEPITLTPFLALAVALLYMLMADGEIDDHESSQLQAVIGGNQDVLELAFEYVETIPLDQFLTDAPALLSTEDKLCILCNLCDCLLADGVSLPVEEELFQKICRALGYSPQSFSTYYSAIALKNEKSLLGTYDSTHLDEDIVTPHLAMAASLLYMMSADGDIAEEEIGQLQVVIGEFEHLQTFAMQYVRRVKMNQFCFEANKALNADQKLLILTNVCDSMMSDGKVADIESRLFENMLDAFGVTEQQFSSYYAPLEIKNFKPFGTDEEVKSLHTRKRNRKKGRGDTFGSNLSHKHSNAVHGKREVNDASTNDDWQSADSEGSLSDIITRTMQENIQQVSETFEDAKDVERVSTNAIDKVLQQGVDQTDSDVNVQKLQEGIRPTNTHKIGDNGFRIHRQRLGEGDINSNRQGLAFMGLTSATPQLISEIRLDDLHKNIDHIHDKLNRITPKPFVKNSFISEPIRKQTTVNLMLPTDATTDTLLGIDDTTDWPEIQFQSVDLPVFERPVFERSTSSAIVSELAVTNEEVADPLEDIPGIPTEVSLLLDQRPRNRSAKYVVLAGAFVVLPMGVYGYGALYPSLHCQGVTEQSRVWMIEAESGMSSASQDSRFAEMHRIEIRRGEVYLDNHRFPLYKELNKDNHFAAQTGQGFQGGYTKHSVENMSYAFDFNETTQALRVFSQSSGVRFIEGEEGHMRVIAVFTGKCEKPWL